MKIYKVHHIVFLVFTIWKIFQECLENSTDFSLQLDIGGLQFIRNKKTVLYIRKSLKAVDGVNHENY